MSAPINIYDAKTHLSALVERAAAGEEIVIAKAGRPRARLVAMGARPRRVPGGWKGALWMADDFDAPLPADLQRAFDGERPRGPRRRPARRGASVTPAAR